MMAAQLVSYSAKKRVKGKLAAGYLNLIIKLMKVKAAEEIRKV